MPKIDFKHFRVFTDISQEKTEVIDISYQFSDMLYKKSNGIMAHDLALRIYKADGPVEFREDELKALQPFVEENFTGLFIDSYNKNIQ